MRFGLACLAAALAATAGVWAWLGAPAVMPHSPLQAGEKLYCVSYAPFRASQDPFDPNYRVPKAQIEEDLRQLVQLTDCVRTYSVDHGLEEITPVAAGLGLKVIQGLWLSSDPVKNRAQIETAVALANRYPDTIRALVVGNEVLLRGELSPNELADTIRAVKARVTVKVTYADVWEYWLRNRDVAAAVDFITIHILPYWEDFPIAANAAAAHVKAIRDRLVGAFPSKEVLIGEVGWPSAGRMREGALPSPANQALVMHSVLALAKRENFHVNLIEAYDQPWKRVLEGTVGGHWGLIDVDTRQVKFVWGKPVSDHPSWRGQAAGGAAFVLLIFGAAFAGLRGGRAPLSLWLAVTANALAGGILIGWTIVNVPLESLGLGGWLRSLGYVALALTSPPLLSAAITRGTPAPRFSRVMDPVAERIRDPLALGVGIVMIAATLLALHAALGLVFDPRYKDFPFAPLTAAVVPLLTHSLVVKRSPGPRGMAELAAAAMLVLSAGYIVLNESLANWQSIWFCLVLVGLGVSLCRVRAAPD
jgi:glucan 1,3-beta-glucosidase